MSIYLGFDASTQSLSAIAIEVTGSRRQVLLERTLVYDDALPRYGTRHGVLPHDDPLVATSSPRMWAEALERMMGEIASSGLDLTQIRAISGSAQQHGSVYLNASAAPALERLDPTRPLVEQVEHTFARADAPIWMDASTATECAEITASVGGATALARLTGSRAFERFTGPQIRRFARRDPAGYARTDRIHLVSSFLVSLLGGGHGPIDPGDGSGMNLMDITTRAWAPVALEATAPDLLRRLPPLAPSWTVVGEIAPYWQRRHGFPRARVVAWSGDNPCSLIGTGMVREGSVTISLGTSDTLFGLLRAPRIDPTGAGHVFGAPTGDYMSLVCCRNGSLAREQVRDTFGLDWSAFSRCLRETSPGNGGAIMLPWFAPEITPPVVEPGVRRFALDPENAAANVRAVVEAQMLALALHARWMEVGVDTIYATGGAAANRAILQVMADVHAADVYQLAVGNSACLGAALRAYHADRLADGDAPAWEEVIAGFVAPVAETRVLPVPAHVAIYADLAPVYGACEAHALGRGPDPAQAIDGFRARHPG